MFGLSENTYQLICSILSNFPGIEKAIIYGSRAKGNYRIGSDIDLAIIGDQLTFDIVINLLNILDESDLPYNFDITLYKSIDNLELKEHIDRAGKVFYKKEL